jgi:hypothetical protein
MKFHNRAGQAARGNFPGWREIVPAAAAIVEHGGRILRQFSTRTRGTPLALSPG